MSNFSDSLLDLAARGATELLFLSWQALILIACVWLGLRIFRVKQPALRHQVWLLTLIVIATLPLAGYLSDKFPALHQTTAVTYVIEAPRTALRPVDSRKLAVAFDQPLASEEQTNLLRLIPPVLLAIWLLGIAIAITKLALRQRGLRAVRFCAEAVQPELPAFENLPSVSVRLSAEIKSPQIAGVFRPVILLPADINSWSNAAEQRAMIQHELAHVVRRDPLANLFQTAMQIVFFFHPAVVYACRQMRAECEHACDDYVLSLGTKPETYAECLLKTAERCLSANGRYQLAFFSARHTLERRVEMILSDHNVRIGRHWKATTCAAILIGLCGWFFLPGTTSAENPQASRRDEEQLQLIESLGQQKDYDKLLELAQAASIITRRLAAARLTELEGDGSTAAMVKLYHQSNDPEVKKMVIDTLARISEIEPLTKIAVSEPNTDFRIRALRRIKHLKTQSESADVRNWDAPGLAEQLSQVQPAPPPPPPPRPKRKRVPPPPPPH